MIQTFGHHFLLVKVHGVFLQKRIKSNFFSPWEHSYNSEAITCYHTLSIYSYYPSTHTIRILTRSVYSLSVYWHYPYTHTIRILTQSVYSHYLYVKSELEKKVANCTTLCLWSQFSCLAPPQTCWCYLITVSSISAPMESCIHPHQHAP